MKKILLVSSIALGLSSVALANGGMPVAAPAPVATPAPIVSDFTPSIYVGLQAGMADTGLKSFSENVDKDFALSGRLFAGYDFSKYFAVETGYFLVQPKTEFKNAGVKVGDVRTMAYDLVGKIKAPVMDNFGVYAKFGPAYLMQKSTAVSGYSDSANKLTVTYGVGAYYNLNDSWSLDAGYTHYRSGQSKQYKDDEQSSVDFYSLGVSYKFNLPA